MFAVLWSLSGCTMATETANIQLSIEDDGLRAAIEQHLGHFGSVSRTRFSDLGHSVEQASSPVSLVVEVQPGSDGQRDLFFGVQSLAGANEDSVSTVIVLALGMGEVDQGSLETLVDGLAKTADSLRIALVSDVPIANRRDAGAPDRNATSVASLAAVVHDLVATKAWKSGHRQNLSRL